VSLGTSLAVVVSVSADSALSDEASLRLAWNVRLRRLGVFPLILPTLDSWVKEAVVSESVVSALTKTLSESQLFRHNRKDITRDHKWLCRIRHIGTKWELLGAIEPFFAVPIPPQSEPRRPFAVFPALAHLAEEHALICHESPYLATHGPTDWPEDVILEMLESVDLSINECVTRVVSAVAFRRSPRRTTFYGFPGGL